MLKKIPNILTIGRILIVPFFVLAFYLPGFYGDLTALILFIVASFTDFLDGLLARLLGEESKLGELLDPIADKIIIATALILLVMDGTIRNYEVIAAIIILTREILISGLREFLAKGKIKLPVSNLAKLKTVLQMISIALLLSGETGNKILFVNSMYTKKILDLSERESDEILKKIFKHQERLDFTCRIKWTENAVAIWDNRSLLHQGLSDFFPGRGLGYERVMDRIAIEGDEPK